ncbi:MAG: spore maturation protein [Clostridia bacterium]|nr:spore maturation protein [Clostridia bacterium]
MGQSLLIPALLVLAVLSALHARVVAYDAFVRGAREGLETVVSVAPYLAAILTAVALLRETGLMDAAQALLSPLLTRLGLPRESLSVVLLRPLSGSAALAAVSEVMHACGPDSRAARIACVISGASETVFFTGSLYLGAAGVTRSRYAVPAALAAYAAGVIAAAQLV